MTDIDQWSHSAAVAIRDEAERVADSRAALAALRADVDGDLHLAPERDTRRWWLVGAAAALVFAVVVGLAALAGRTPETRPVATTPPGLTDLGPIEEFPTGSVTQIGTPSMFVVSDHAGIVVFDGHSTHLGCPLVLNEDAAPDDASPNPDVVFVDPCHFSTFARDGHKVGGPAPRGLDRYAVTISAGRVLVDRAVIIPGESYAVVDTTIPVSSVPSTAVPPSTSPPVADGAIDVEAVVREAGVLIPRELHRFTVGDGPDQLGIEPGEDTPAPWAAVIYNWSPPDAVVVIADTYNERWVTVPLSGGEPVLTPFPEGFAPISAPQVGPDHRIWVVDANEGGPGAVLRSYEPADLAIPAESFDLPTRSLYSTLWFDNASVVVNGDVVTMLDAFPMPLRPVEWSGSRVIVSGADATGADVTTTWQFGDAAIGPALVPESFNDGSVLAYDRTDESFTLLYADGTASRFQLPGVLMAENGSSWAYVDFRGTHLVRLEDDAGELVVREYVLPVPGSERDVEVTPLESARSAEEVCTAAIQTVAPYPDESAGGVAYDASSQVDGQEQRWLVCVDGTGAMGFGVAVLTTTDSRSWRLAVPWPGWLAHGDNHVDVRVEGGRALITFSSAKGESCDPAQASTDDGGTTWTVVKPTSCSR